MRWSCVSFRRRDHSIDHIREFIDILQWRYPKSIIFQEDLLDHLVIGITAGPTPLELDQVAEEHDLQSETIWEEGMDRNVERVAEENAVEERIAEQVTELLYQKNLRYGNNLPRHGMRGIVIRMSDKILRLENIVLGDQPESDDESLDNTLLDLAGYAIKALALRELGLLPLEGTWREENFREKQE